MDEDADLVHKSMVLLDHYTVDTWGRTPAADVLEAAPQVILAGIASAWVGWALGGLVLAVAAGSSPREVFGGVARSRLVVAAVLALVLVGAVTAYRPASVVPPASVRLLGLAPDTTFDHRDAPFWEARLPDDWREPGHRSVYQEAVVDGHPLPVGAGWCAQDDATLDRDLRDVSFSFNIT